KEWEIHRDQPLIILLPRSLGLEGVRPGGQSEQCGEQHLRPQPDGPVTRRRHACLLSSGAPLRWRDRVLRYCPSAARARSSALHAARTWLARLVLRAVSL